MKRVVCEPIGGLDERFGMGFLDDDDLAERARRAGFQLRSDRAVPEQFAFNSVPLSSFAPSWLCVRSDSSNAKADAPIHGEKAKVSLTMIVRDERRTPSGLSGALRPCFIPSASLAGDGAKLVTIAPRCIHSRNEFIPNPLAQPFLPPV
jgi:hypothetical protein